MYREFICEVFLAQNFYCGCFKMFKCLCLLLEWVPASGVFQVISPYFQRVTYVTNLTGRSYDPSAYYSEFYVFSKKYVLSSVQIWCCSCVAVHVALMQILLLYFLGIFFFYFLQWFSDSVLASKTLSKVTVLSSNMFYLWPPALHFQNTGREELKCLLQKAAKAKA